MTALLDRIKPYLGVLKLAASLAALAYATWWWHAFKEEQQAIGYQEAAAEYAVKLAEAKDVARQLEQDWNAKWEKATHERAQTEQRLAAARAAAATANRRLHSAADDFRERLSTATDAAARDAAATAAELLATCSGEYRDVAAAADGHVADAAQCRAAWPGD